MLADLQTGDTRQRMILLARFLSRPSPWRVLVLLWAGVLFWLSEQSNLPSPASFSGVDKIEHAVFFAAGGACFLMAMRLAGFLRLPTAAILVTTIFCSLVGGLDEWHQTFTPGRSGGDVWDWAADTVGGFLGALAGLGLQKRITSAGTTTSAVR